MKESDILEIINQGENSSVEFKSTDVKIDTLAKEMIAFANLNGGIIFIGVEDNKLISGISTNKNWEEWIMNIARNNINPPLNVDFFTKEISEKTIAIIKIQKGNNKPYQTQDGKYYIRVGSTNRIASINELMRLFQEIGIFHFDATEVENTDINSLNINKIANYFESYKLNYEKLSEDKKLNLLINTDILTKQNKTTVAGLMIFGINPQRYLRMASVSFAHFAGNQIVSELIDKQNIEGNLDYQIDTTLAIIKNNLRNTSEIVGAKRQNTKHIYSDKVFRELITNAICHRNYSIYGSKIRIFLFDDRLEIISPGKLPNTVTIEKLKAGVSYSVNPVIIKFMENIYYIDKLGRGLPMVCNEAEAIGKKVNFEELGEEFKVTLEL